MVYTRSSANPPAYYYNLNEKQKKNWMKTTIKMEHNEKLREKFPPFRAASNTQVVHIHHQATKSILDELINKASKTKRYTIDTEGVNDRHGNKGVLIQIQFVHSINDSTLVIVETNYLPEPESTLYMKIKQLFGIILDNGNEIITWGPLENEFQNFNHINWIKIGKVIKQDLQFLFSNPNAKPQTHPEMERREVITGCSSMSGDTPSDDDYYDELFDDYRTYPTRVNEPVSLQNAIAQTFNKFLDKSLTLNQWDCGLDPNLNTWKNKLFSKGGYNKLIEQQQRENMLQYAMNDCTSVTELFFHMYPEKAKNDRTPPETPKTPTITTTTTTNNSTIYYDEELSNISEEEIMDFIRTTTIEAPKSSITEEQITTITEEPITTTTETRTTTIETSTTGTAAQLTQEKLQQLKKERQKRKNEKYKWKKKNKPEFQNKMKRPIYHRYDYKKIRAQLRDDNIHTTHQITINKHLGEVMIGFKSSQELQWATNIVKINYFSKAQYINRWKK